MLTALLRTVIIYTLLLAAMRLMGKRQIGELEISDLVTTFLVSEIATLPISDPSLPLSRAMIPIVLLLSFEVLISFLLSRFPFLKRAFTARPSTLVRNGQLCQKAMSDARISFDELFCELRRQGADDISKIKYAILEQNGSITVIQKARHLPPSAEQLHLKVEDNGLFYIIIDHGYVNSYGLARLSLSREWLESQLKKKRLCVSDVYLMMINDAGEQRIIKKEKRK